MTIKVNPLRQLLDLKPEPVSPAVGKRRFISAPGAGQKEKGRDHQFGARGCFDISICAHYE